PDEHPLVPGVQLRTAATWPTVCAEGVSAAQLTVSHTLTIGCAALAHPTESPRSDRCPRRMGRRCGPSTRRTRPQMTRQTTPFEGPIPSDRPPSATATGPVPPPSPGPPTLR